jgi:uncharacterized membrane protein
MDEVLNAFSSYPALVIATGIATGYLNKWTKLSGFKEQALSWIIAILLTYIGVFLNEGIFMPDSSMVWYLEGIVKGFVIGLAANGIVQIPNVLPLLNRIGAKHTSSDE